MEKTNEEIRKELEAIIASVDNPEEAINKIVQAYPSINAEELRKNYEAEKGKAEEKFRNQEITDDVENLSDEALEEVAGGNFGGWVKKNWPYLLLGAAAIGFTTGMTWQFLKRQNTAANASTEAMANSEAQMNMS